MCNFNSYKSPEQIELFEDIVEPIPFNSDLAGFNEFPDWPIIVPNSHAQYENVLMNWTLIPVWAKDLEEARKYSTQNAIIEEITEKRSFKDAVLKRRCLVMSSGFYEWRHLPKIGKKGQELKSTEAYPYFISIKDKDYFFMAGVWQPYDRNGQHLNTFSICTTHANKPMQAIHNKIDAKTGKPKHRMPLILNDEQAVKWLKPNLTVNDIKEFADIKVPDNIMQYHTVAKDFKSSTHPQQEFTYHIPDIAK